LQSVFTLEQLFLIIVVCFAFCGFVLIIALHEERTYPKLFGLSLILPLLLAGPALLASEQSMREWVLRYLDIIYVLLIFLLTAFWSRLKYYGGLVLLVLYTILSFTLGLKLNALSWPAWLLSPYLHGLIILLLTLAINLLHKKSGLKKDLSLLWGLVILALMQFLPGEKWLLITAFGRAFAYYLLFMFVFKNSIRLAQFRLKKAHSKLAELNKSIDKEVKKRIIELERHNEHLLRMVKQDPLVDAYNKKEIYNLLGEMIAEPYAEPFSLILFDLDNFKIINDTKGHIEGDRVLKKVAMIARESIRGFDVLGRFGGDEFIIILRGARVSDAVFIAERFRRRVKEKSEVTVSIGVAGYPEDGKTVKEILEVADAGLYEAKKLGKNAVFYKSPK
jgi:diguanylate cyclase (GGDEF)-like protein